MVAGKPLVLSLNPLVILWHSFSARGCGNRAIADRLCRIVARVGGDGTRRQPCAHDCVSPALTPERVARPRRHLRLHQIIDMVMLLVAVLVGMGIVRSGNPGLLTRARPADATVYVILAAIIWHLAPFVSDGGALKAWGIVESTQETTASSTVSGREEMQPAMWFRFKNS